jgi:hypothetical protein
MKTAELHSTLALLGHHLREGHPTVVLSKQIIEEIFIELLDSYARRAGVTREGIRRLRLGRANADVR